MERTAIDAAAFPIGWPDLDSLTAVELEGLASAIREVQVRLARESLEAMLAGNAGRRRYLEALGLHLAIGRAAAHRVLLHRLGLDSAR